ncbi:MAG: DUF4249 domain-containing protein [Bacteroidota bacterium]
MNCKDSINLPGEGSIGLLVIDGKVNTLPGPYTLRLGYTVGLDQKPIPVSLAQATLIDDDASLSEQYTETKPGVYTLPGAIIQGTAGHHYHVEVTLSNGHSYATKPELIPDAVGVDTPYFEVGQKTDYINDVEIRLNVVNVYVDAQLPQDETGSYVRWNATETYMFEPTPIIDPLIGKGPDPCYVDGVPDNQKVVLYSTRGNQLQTLHHVLVTQRKIDQSFLARHYFTVYQNSISVGAYSYWKNVDQLINRSGSIFDTPPAPIAGNAFSKNDSDEKVLGYFEAGNTTLSRFFVLRNDIPLEIPPYCNDPQHGVYWPLYPAECYKCTKLDNSSNTAPDWWPR